MLWSLLTILQAAARPVPVTCEAVFTGPAGHCKLEGQWMASGTASSEDTARKRALERLSEATELAMEAHSLQTAGTLAFAIAEQNRAVCPTVLTEQVQISCFPSLELSASQTCFADFKAEGCPQPDVLILEGVGFKTMEKARQQICRETDQLLEAAELSEAEQLACQSRCLIESRIRCR